MTPSIIKQIQWKQHKHNKQCGVQAFSNYCTVSGVTRLGNQPISISIGPKIPQGSPEEIMPNFGLRASLTFVLTK
jgi:hypothetical protein